MKWVAIVLLVIVAAAGGFAAYVPLRGIPTYEPHVVEFKVVSTPERVVQGRNLAMMLCVHCHTDPITRQLTGTKLLDLPAEFGTAYSKNITQDKEHGIGNWSNNEIVYLLRTGIHPKTKHHLHLLLFQYLTPRTTWPTESTLLLVCLIVGHVAREISRKWTW